MDKKVRIECTGIIESVLNWNNEVYISLKVKDKTNKFKISRNYCNPRKLYVGDVVKVMGTICEYNDEDNGYSAAISLGSVQKLLGKNKPKNNKMDFAGDFSFIGFIEEISKADSEFYQLLLKTAGEDESVHTIYVLAEDYESSLITYNPRELVHIQGKVSYTAYSEFFFDNIPISKLRNYAIYIEIL